MPFDAPVEHAEWSPDGGHFVVELEVTGSFGTGRNVAVAATDASNLTWIGGSTGFGRRHPTWSPDGSRVAYRRFCDGSVCTEGWGLWSSAADGSGEEVSVTEGVDPLDPAWAPDGSGLLFSDGPSLWVTDVDGAGEPARLVTEGAIGSGSWLRPTTP